MRKLWIITVETFLRQIKSWSFLALVIAPFLILVLSFGLGYINYSSGESSNKIAVISEHSALRKQFIQQNKDEVKASVDSVKEAKKAVAENQITGYVIFDTTATRVSATFRGGQTPEVQIKNQVNSFIVQQQQQLNLANAKLSPDQAKALQQQPQYNEIVHKKTGRAKIARLISFWIMVVMVYMILITYSSITATEIASEKGTKIMKIIFSSTTAGKYFVGKILGVLLVILTQLVAYVVGGWSSYLVAQHMSFTKGFVNSNQDLISQVLSNLLSINLVFLFLGVILYTILSAFSGALVAKAEDATKAAQPATYLGMIAFFATFPFQNNADVMIVKIMSYVPFFSSYFMPLRIIDQSVNGWEVAISLLILIGSIILMVQYISRIYEGLMLQTDDTSFWKRFKRGISYQ
ncbi:ABC transporter permease [Paucilactobacillus kaifaensis]|uniref:ABC transporter permease n=1 Tax=Paucilactobacillus kaifaensis TaxID=2559921 RepID=UPI0010F672B8|nr:ABC transporter permease [Paucilactobacillus kaifaensis]